VTLIRCSIRQCILRNGLTFFFLFLLQGAWWEVHFGVGIKVSRVTIYNRNDKRLDSPGHDSDVSARLSDSNIMLLNYQDIPIKTYRIGNARDIPMFNISSDMFIFDTTSTCYGGTLSCPNLQSSNQECHLNMQEDGNLVVYKKSGTELQPFWASNTQSHGTSPYKLAMQNDGNLVIRDNTMQSIWASNTTGMGSAPYRLVVQNDCNLVIFGGRDTVRQFPNFCGNGNVGDGTCPNPAECCSYYWGRCSFWYCVNGDDGDDDSVQYDDLINPNTGIRHSMKQNMTASSKRKKFN
jgi:hypothetical protein